MGCLRCGRRQVDPVSGPSDWRRAVVHGAQVLVCPDCQTPGWTDGLDRCASCGSTALSKRLGVVVCRACGHEDAGAPTPEPGERAPASGGPGRAAEGAPDDTTRRRGHPSGADDASGPDGAPASGGTETGRSQVAPGGSEPDDDEARAALAAEVAAAVDRVLGRG